MRKRGPPTCFLPLNVDAVNRVVEEHRKGIYLLVDTSGPRPVWSVGRSDTSVADDLRAHARGRRVGFMEFLVAYCDIPRETYKDEVRFSERSGTVLINKRWPVKPEGN